MVDVSEIAASHSDIMIMSGSDVPQIKPGRTDILGLDLALRGGLPRGGFSIICGKEGSLKTTVALRAASRHVPLLYIDADRSFNKDWFSHLGLDLENTIVAYPSSMEDAYNILDKEVQNPVWGSIVIDSLGMLSPENELEANSEKDTAMAMRARRTNAVIRRIAMRLKPTSTVMIILIQHLYAQVGAVPMPDIMPAGRAQRYLSQVIVTLKRTDRLPASKNQDLQGFNVQWALTKSKVSKDGQVGTFRFWVQGAERDGVDMPSGSIDTLEQLEEYLPGLDMLQRSGPIYTLKVPGHDEVKYNGKNALREGLKVFESVIYEAIHTGDYTSEDALAARNEEYLERVRSKDTAKKTGKRSAKKTKPSPKKVDGFMDGIMNLAKKKEADDTDTDETIAPDGKQDTVEAEAAV